MNTPAPGAMPTGNFTITINTFRPLGAVFPISATITPAPDNPKCITIAGKNIQVCSKNPVQLNFQLDNPATGPGYVLLGVAFAANQSDTTVGMHTFPTIQIQRTPRSSCMSVTDQPQNLGVPQHYSYVILVQCIRTGQIGMIDPEITNEPEH